MFLEGLQDLDAAEPDTVNLIIASKMSRDPTMDGDNIIENICAQIAMDSMEPTLPTFTTWVTRRLECQLGLEHPYFWGVWIGGRGIQVPNTRTYTDKLRRHFQGFVRRLCLQSIVEEMSREFL
jgi:hypothetical protein